MSEANSGMYNSHRTETCPNCEKLEKENAELRKYKDRLDFPMEELVCVLPAKEGSPKDAELVLEAVEHIKELRKRVEWLENEIRKKDCPSCGVWLQVEKLGEIEEALGVSKMSKSVTGENALDKVNDLLKELSELRKENEDLRGKVK